MNQGSETGNIRMQENFANFASYALPTDMGT